MKLNLLIAGSVFAFGLLVNSSTAAATNETVTIALSPTLRPTTNAQFLARSVAKQVLKAGQPVAPVPPGAVFKSAPAKTRGPELTAVYDRCGPAVVAILMKQGDYSGTGFLISDDGWLITNNHVAEEATPSDKLTSQVTAILGQTNSDGLIEPQPVRYKADVYKLDPARDLALLKLVQPDTSHPVKNLPFLKLAAQDPRPGNDVVSIGQGSVTLLWSLKPGQVQGIGKLNANTANVLARWERASSQSADTTFGSDLPAVREQLNEVLGETANTLFVLATCPIFPGDSGGPLLNMKGEVIGVNCMGQSAADMGAARYFIHRKELAAFLEDKPDLPVVTKPSIWDSDAVTCDLKDFDSNGRFDVMLLYGTHDEDGDAPLLGVGWDLDEDTDYSSYTRSDGRVASGRVYDDRAMMLDVSYMFYNHTLIFAADTDGDGTIDLIRLDSNADGRPDRVFTLPDKSKPFQARQPAATERNADLPDTLPPGWRARYNASLKVLNLK